MASLDDYAMPGVSTNIAPSLASRLLKVLDHFGGRVVIESGYRSAAQQQKLYDDWVASGYTNPPSVAKPGTSKHEHDPADAADLHRTDPTLTWGEVHYTAAAYGLRFPIPREDWHAEEDPAWVEPEPPEEDDMTPQQLADSIGAKLVNGVIVVPLVNDDLATFADYPLAAAITYTHQEMKIKRING